MAVRRKVLGDAWVDRSLANRTDFNSEIQQQITSHVWGDIWTRPHFDHRTRRVLVIGTMVALGQWDEFRLHVRAALTEGGFTPDDIKEILLQQAIYCGVPAANHAVKEANAIIAESTLSFLGLGFPPDIPSWGRILYDAKDYLDSAPHWALFAGGAIFFAVMAINYIGDGLRDALDPRRVI